MTPTPEQLSAIKQARQAALLEKWMGGQRLSVLEIEEIAHLVPQGALDAPPPPVSAPSLNEPEYHRTTEEYARLFECQPRTIKYWRTRGRRMEPPDYVPLDDPAAMLGWWSRTMSIRAPDRLVQLAAAADSATAEARSRPVTPAPRAGEPSSPSAPAPAAPGPAGDGEPVRRDFSGVEVLDMDGQLRGLRRAASISLAMLEDATSGGIESVIAMRQTNYNRALETLRKAEETFQAMAIKRGDYVPKADVIADLSGLISGLVAMRRRMPAKVADKVPWLTGEQRAQLVAAIEEVRSQEDVIFQDAHKWRDVAHVED